MKIALFGATGRVGRVVYDHIGHDARCLVRKNRNEGTDILGNVLDSEAVASTVKGCEAVISCLNTDKEDVLSRSMPIILDAMRKEGISRIITCGTAGILNASNSNGLYRFQSSESKRRSTTAAEDHLSAYLMLKASGMDWTIVCPTYLPEGERVGRFRTTEEVLPENGTSISVYDTADFMVQVLEERWYIKKRVGISY
ncbi:NAD(P)H-binding protein [Rossellomorea sp. RS05]|uniref:NAD(P)-dependent oxidoreductase n=1 Tax=Rossellomorea sp. RS05 TaxID=3149166 RepID=UPI003221FF4A